MRPVGLAIAVFLGLTGTGWAQAPPPNVRLNSDISPYLQNEEQIWINLTDSLNVVADWRDWRLGYRRVGVGVSTNGGLTWKDSLIVGIYDRQSDPCLVGDRNGVFYMNTLDYQSSGPASTISVWKSTDGGQSWSLPVAAVVPGPYFEDKQYTTVDRTGGTFDGNYYFSWTRFPNDGSHSTIQFVRSTDGAVSFFPPVAVGPPNTTPCGTYDAGQSSMPIVEKDGRVHVFWQGVDVDPGTCQTFWSIRHAVSTSGGFSFAAPTTLYRQRLGWGTVDGGINVYGFPNGDADISDGPYGGTIYLSQTYWAPGVSDMDITVRKSTDHGVTWSEPNIVNDDAPGHNIDQFHPWLSINEDGTLVLVFYDQRNDPVNHYMFDCYFSASFDGGETFIRNYRLSTVSSTPDNLLGRESMYMDIRQPGDSVSPLLTPLDPTAGKIAEYIGVHARHDRVVAVWTDTRDGTQDVYSTNFTIPFMAPRLYYPADGIVSPAVDTTFRWSTCWHEADDAYRLEVSTDPGFATIDYSFDGLAESSLRPDPPLPPGDYFWRVKAFRAAGDSTEYSEVYSLSLGCSGGAAPTLVYPAANDSVETTSVALDWADVGDALGYGLQVAMDAGFTSLIVDTEVVSSEFVAELADSTQYYWRVNSTNACATGAWAESQFVVATCPIDLAGDVNVDAVVTSADVIYLVAYAFKGGPAPLPLEVAGDVNCDGEVTSADIIYLVNYIFKSGPAPCDICALI